MARNTKQTGQAAATVAGKTLASSKSSKAARSAAASVLAQTATRKRGKR